MDVGDTECYLAHLAVSEDHQGKGVGSILIEASRKFAEDNGFTRLTLIVSDKNPDARRLYERKGFVTDEVKYGLVEKMMFDDPVWWYMGLDVTSNSPCSSQASPG